jgi:hypothetical protein
VRKADLKALWLPDRKRILIDSDIPDLKKRHREAHEITHSITPHHSVFLFGDDDETLRHSCYEKLEAEANFGSGQLLFLRDRFVQEAQDFPLKINSIRNLAKKFGNTITMTLWRMIEEAHKGEPIFGIISVHPMLLANDFDSSSPCRYFIESPVFRERFGNVSEIEAFSAMQSYSSRARGGPLGEDDVIFFDRNGNRHYFHMESFSNQYDTLTIGKYLRPVLPQVAVLQKNQF